MTTPNMGLTQPGVLTTIGPTYATQQNTDLTLLDAHDHSSGKGVQVSQTGLLFSGDLSFRNGTSYYGPTNLAYAQFKQQTLQGTGTKVGSLMVNGSGELYYQDGAGNNVQLTSGGSIIPNGTGTANGFYGNYASVVAKANFVSATATYSFYTDNLTTYAKMNALGFRSLGSSANSSGFTNVKSDGSSGWQLWNNTGNDFYLTFDPTGTPINALTVVATGVNNQYGLTLNGGVGANGVIELSSATENNGSPALYGTFNVRTGTAVPADGFGQTWAWNGSVLAGTTATTYPLASMVAQWATKSTKLGRWRLFGATGGSVDATAAIEVLGGGGFVGIGKAANASWAMDVATGSSGSLRLASSLSILANGANISGGLTVTTGGITVSAGNVNITGLLQSSDMLTVLNNGANIAGGLSIGTGGITVAAGDVTVTGAVNASTAITSSLSGNAINASAGDLTAVGGFKMPAPLFLVKVLTASQTDDTLSAYPGWTAPYAGSIMAITWSNQGSIGAGNLFFRVFKNGVALAGTQSPTYISGNHGVATFVKDAAIFAAGDTLEVRYTTNGAYADGGGYTTVGLIVEC